MPLKVYTPIKPWKGFEEVYVKARKAEGRILSDADLQALPNVPSNHPLAIEWQMRRKSFQKLSSFLPEYMSILDVGCGNGWMSHQLAKQSHLVLGIDVNLLELEQAVGAFNHKNLSFAFADVYDWTPKENFNVAVIASVIQYFENPKSLVLRLFEANPTLERILISDSPFYTESDKAKAGKRTADYYKKQGVGQMRNHYHHHSLNDLGLPFKKLYAAPKKWINTFAKNPPFPILEIERP